MSVISWREAMERWLESGMDDLFSFDEYIEYLASCHIVVARNE